MPETARVRQGWRRSIVASHIVQVPQNRMKDTKKTSKRHETSPSSCLIEVAKDLNLYFFGRHEEKTKGEEKRRKKPMNELILSVMLLWFTVTQGGTFKRKHERILL